MAFGQNNSNPLSNSFVELRGIVKRYPGVTALRDVDLSLRPGVITALAGENGAGKSTLIKVLSGAVQPDQGSVRVGGRDLPPDPRGVIDAGVSVIYQELTDIPDMTVTDNVLLGRPIARSGFVRQSATEKVARAALSRVGLGSLDIGLPISLLSMAQRQLVEIARCLARNAKVLVFDEPTSSLSGDDVTNLMETIRGLRQDGLALLYVSHHLTELFEIADEIVVMRDGSVVDHRPTSEWTESQLVSSMLARDLAHAYPWKSRLIGDVTLDVQGLSAEGIYDASMNARAGEIVGLAGLAGAGRTELLKAIAGASFRTAGEVFACNVPVTPGSISSARAAGVVYVPEDRKREGLVLEASVQENLVLGLFSSVARAGFVLRRKLAETARFWLVSFGVRAESPQQTIRTLSGGNQQKVILGRVAFGAARIVLLDDPTRGVDVGSKSAIYERVLEWVDQGMTVVLTSSDTDEVLSMTDRLYILKAGRIVAEVPRSDYDREAVLAMASLKKNAGGSVS